MNFEQWMKRVDSIVGAIGLSVYDLPDFPSRDYFDSGMTPAEAVEEAAAEWWDMPDDLVETLSILSDDGAMAAIAEAERDVENGDLF